MDRMPVSFSGMMLYESCPSAFWRRYIAKEDVAKGVPSNAMLRGLDAHSDVEQYLDGEDCELPDVAMGFEGMMGTLRNDRCVKSECKFGFDDEWNLSPFDAPTTMIRGILDGVYVYADLIHVMEWKTGKWYEEHAKQRSLYALAGLALYPHLDDVLVQTFYFDLGKSEALELNRKHADAHKRIWKARSDAVQPPQDYPQTPNWKCTGKKKYCDYHCSKGGKCDGQAT